MTRIEAEQAARATPIPEFKAGDIWERRGGRYVIMSSRLTELCFRCRRRKAGAALIERAVRGGRKRLVRSRCTSKIETVASVSLLDPLGSHLEADAALFFNDPRWPARKVGTDTETLRRAQERAKIMGKARDARGAGKGSDETE